MIQMTVQLPEELAKRVQPLRSWLPVIIELSLIGFQTLATATATEIIQFLATNPTPEEVFKYHVSERAQQRLRRLLALNEAGLISEDEHQELLELQQIEHLIIMLKAQLAKQLRQEG